MSPMPKGRATSSKSRTRNTAATTFIDPEITATSPEERNLADRPCSFASDGLDEVVLAPDLDRGVVDGGVDQGSFVGVVQPTLSKHQLTQCQGSGDHGMSSINRITTGSGGGGWTRTSGHQIMSPAL